MNALQIIINPNKVFKKIEENTQWGTDFIVVSFLLVIVAFFMFPATLQIMDNMEAIKNMSAKQIEMIKNTAQKMQYLGLLAEPIIFIAKCLFIAVILYFGSVICQGKKVFKKLFALTISASLIIALSNIANITVLHLKGIENVKCIFDFYAISLNIFFNVNNIGVPLYQFLSNFNIFEFWFVIILILGVSKLAQISKKKASIIVITTWLILVAFNVIQILLSNNTMHNY